MARSAVRSLTEFRWFADEYLTAFAPAGRAGQPMWRPGDIRGGGVSARKGRDIEGDGQALAARERVGAVPHP